MLQPKRQITEEDGGDGEGIERCALPWFMVMFLLIIFVLEDITLILPTATK